MASSSYAFGAGPLFEFRPAERKLLCDGASVALGSRAAEVLLALVEAGGEMVTKDALLSRAWPGLVVEDANVYVTIAQLRKVLGTDAITTVGGLGYRFAWPLDDRPGEAPTNNLPAERTPFVGRSALLREAQSRLRKTRLLTLTGMGGTGKTRLALKLAEFSLSDFRHGVWWVNLAPATEASELTARLADVVGCKLNAPGSAWLAIGATCRAREMLLVLDNCEQIRDAIAAGVDALLTVAPGLKIVATSRDALRVEGESVMPVGPLEVPAIGGPLERWEHAESVQTGSRISDRSRSPPPHRWQPWQARRGSERRSSRARRQTPES